MSADGDGRVHPGFGNHFGKAAGRWENVPTFPWREFVQALLGAILDRDAARLVPWPLLIRSISTLNDPGRPAAHSGPNLTPRVSVPEAEHAVMPVPTSVPLAVWEGLRIDPVDINPARHRWRGDHGGGHVEVGGLVVAPIKQIDAVAAETGFSSNHARSTGPWACRTTWSGRVPR